MPKYNRAMSGKSAREDVWFATDMNADSLPELVEAFAEQIPALQHLHDDLQQHLLRQVLAAASIHHLHVLAAADDLRQLLVVGNENQGYPKSTVQVYH